MEGMGGNKTEIYISFILKIAYLLSFIFSKFFKLYFKVNFGVHKRLKASL